MKILRLHWTYLELVTLTILVTTTRSQLPDFQWDVYVEDHATESTHVDTIYSMRYQNEDKPDHCRNDMCPTTHLDAREKGKVTWPTTVAGNRRYVRCPYAVKSRIYGYRDCVLGTKNGTLVPMWKKSHMEDCPETPLNEALKKMTSDLKEYQHPNESFCQNHFGAVLDMIREYYDQPYFSENILDIFSTINHVLSESVRQEEAMTSPTLDVTFRLLDWMVKKHDTYFAASIIDYGDFPKVVWLFTIITEMLQPPTTGKMTLLGDSATIIVETTYDYLKQTGPFVARDLSNPMAADVSLELPWEGPKAVRLMYLPIVDYFQQVDFYDRWFSDQLDTDNPDYQVVLSYDLYDPSLVLAGPVLYVSVSRDPSQTWSLDNWKQRASNMADVVVSYAMQYDNKKSVDNSASKCAQNQPEVDSKKYDVLKWYGTHCDVISNEWNVTSCRCNGTGFYGVFSEVRSNIDNYFYDWNRPTSNNNEDTALAQFLGFPYRYELYVTSHVFRALSLVCLILTVTSYVIHRKTRRGIPTKILLNLCGSLIALLVALYVAEGISHTKYGCRVSNVLRYYLVLVSLMWNGVEAVNMYMMLVRVFNHQTHRFVLKSACVAWGGPLVLVALVFVISVKGFDGVYTEDCTFRCRLKNPVLYYGYLVPMGIILLSNIVIFSLVMKVLRASSNVATSKTKNHNTFVRLCGAVSMMILLGIPWIFSAFGAIDAPETKSALYLLEGIFHVVFVVCVNLQGVFIFCFHCAKNAEMRQQWKQTLSSRTQSTSVSSDRRSRVSSQKHRPLSTGKDRAPSDDSSEARSSLVEKRLTGPGVILDFAKTPEGPGMKVFKQTCV